MLGIFMKSYYNKITSDRGEYRYMRINPNLYEVRLGLE